ncbi:Glutamate [NMDA] receptor subunit 1, partial [Cichlidogyrus casuarinus]
MRDHFRKLHFSLEKSFNKSPINFSFNYTLIDPGVNDISLISNLQKFSPTKFTAVITGITGENSEQLLRTISLACSYLNTPLISFSSKSSLFSDKYRHKYFLRTISSSDNEMPIWELILKQLIWDKITIIALNTYESQLTLTQLMQDHSNKSYQVMDYKKLPPSEMELQEQRQERIGNMLKEIKARETRAILLYVDKQTAELVFKQAEQNGMLAEGWGWLASEDALAAENRPIGLLAIRPVQKDHIEQLDEANNIVTRSIQNLVEDEKSLDLKPESLFLRMKSYQKNGRPFFDSKGRIFSQQYQIINVGSHRQLIPVGNYSFDQGLSLSTDKIIWPGPSNHSPNCFKKKTNLKVVTILSIPFVQARKLRDPNDACRSAGPDELNAEVECQRYNGK